MKHGWKIRIERSLNLASSLDSLLNVFVAAAGEVWTGPLVPSDHDVQEFRNLLKGHLERVLRIEGFSSNPIPEDKLDDSNSKLRRLIELGDLLIIRADPNFVVKEVQGNTERLLGVSRDEILRDPRSWRRFISNRDLRELRLKISAMTFTEEFSAEVRTCNRNTNEIRWFLVKGTPLFSREGALLGWEGFGLDITEKHQFQEDVVAERRRLEALYEVSRALNVPADPAVSILKGIRALKKATQSDSAIACLYDQKRDLIELVAAEGFDEEMVSRISQGINGESLMRRAIREESGLILRDDDFEMRSSSLGVVKAMGLRSAIFVPMTHESTVLGGLALFSRRRNRFADADLDVIDAAASQLTLAVRQTEGVVQELKHASVVSTLYKVSHELSRLMTPREMAAHIFPIIQSELACKRMWFGILSEQGTHLIGQAGTGPGMRRAIIDLQIDLRERHDFLDDVLKSREAVVVSADTAMECSTLNRIRNRLEVGMFVLVPLVSLGQVVGVLFLEPLIDAQGVAHRKLPVLLRVASEMATIMVARKFENKMAESDKMRMAGVLAAGVAHNFNNLLQAILGQASLIEIQSPKGSPLAESARMITESATKGAGLIKQLMSFSMTGGTVRRTMKINSLLEDSEDLYRSLLGSRIAFSLNLSEEIPLVYGDTSQIQQVITNLLVNAKEAIGDKKGGAVMVSTSEVTLRPEDVDPELAAGRYLRVEVQDNGVGMDSDRLARCFEPFYTTKDVDARTGIGLSGSGLGLSTSYSIVKQHEGWIGARSRPGEGSVFTVYLPALGVKEDSGEGAGSVRGDGKRAAL